MNTYTSSFTYFHERSVQQLKTWIRFRGTLQLLGREITNKCHNVTQKIELMLSNWETCRVMVLVFLVQIQLLYVLWFYIFMFETKFAT